MDKLIDVQKLAASIPDGSTIALVGFGGMGQCDKILRAIRQRFDETGHPRNLTIFHTAGQSDRQNGIEHLAVEGLVSRVIGGHWGLAPKMQRLIQENKVDAYCFPQGQLTHMLRAIANKLPGQLSPVGLGTFIDPRMGGGKFNQRTKEKEDLVELVTIAGKEWLLYKAISFDYVFIRATTADEQGNLTAEEEPLKLEILSAANATKACGGQVIAQVKYLAKKGIFHPKQVSVPGYLVDHVVVAEDYETEHRQLPSCVYHPVFSGDVKVPTASKTVPLDIRKVIGRRAVLELNQPAVVNLGIGIPGDVIGPIAEEEKISDQIILTLESGIIGGVPVGANEFGVARNAEAIIDHEYLFDYYHGTGVDIAFMGAAEVDRQGNVNVSQFAGRSVGCGGFIDITQPAKKVVFCTTFTGKNLNISLAEGKVTIVQEGEVKKFTQQVEQITFSGRYAVEQGQEVIYVTERAVFTLTEHGLMLTEIAPGIQLERDILAQMSFEPLIAPELKQMDSRIFQPKPMFA